MKMTPAPGAVWPARVTFVPPIVSRDCASQPLPLGSHSRRLRQASEARTRRPRRTRWCAARPRGSWRCSVRSGSCRIVPQRIVDRRVELGDVVHDAAAPAGDIGRRAVGARERRKRLSAVHERRGREEHQRSTVPRTSHDNAMQVLAAIRSAAPRAGRPCPDAVRMRERRKTIAARSTSPRTARPSIQTKSRRQCNQGTDLAINRRKNARPTPRVETGETTTAHANSYRCTRRAALGQRFDLGQLGHRDVAGERREQRAVGPAEPQAPLPASGR